MIRLGRSKSKCIMIFVTGLLLTACVSNDKDNKAQNDAVLPMKAPQQVEPPVANPTRKRGPEPSPNYKHKVLAAVSAVAFSQRPYLIHNDK